MNWIKHKIGMGFVRMSAVLLATGLILTLGRTSAQELALDFAELVDDFDFECEDCDCDDCEEE